MISIGRIRPSLNEFKVFFNERTRNVRPELFIHKIEMNYNNHNPLFFIQLSTHDAIIGCVSRMDGTIKQIAILRQNDGTRKSRFEFLVGITMLLEALRPNMDMKEKSKILESINFFKDGFDIYNAQVHSQIGDMNVMLLSSTLSGFFSFSLTFR